MTNLSKKYNNLSEIPSSNYEGYIWMSNEKHPLVLNDEAFDFNSIKTNPFIIEGLLFDKVKNISIHIIHAGQYIISQYHLSNLNPELLVAKEYLPHRIEGIEKVLFKQIWYEKEDENCESFPVLTIIANVFCGFKKNNKL